MNALDLLLALPLLWGLYKGYKNGFILETATFVGLLAGTYAAVHFSGIAESYLGALIGADPEWASLIAFAITFLAVLLLVHLLARAIRGMIRFVALGLVDRLFGSLFGLLKMTLFLAVILILVRSMSPGSERGIPPEMVEDSLILRNMDKVTEEVMEWDLGEEWSFERDQEAET